MLAQLLVNRNIKNTGSNHGDEYNNDEHPKTEKSKESSSIDADVIKDIQAQIASLTQRDKLKKVGWCILTCWNGTQFPIHQNSEIT